MEKIIIPKKVACYVRVSTENQLENYSIDEQTDRLNSYCKAKDYTIYSIYTDGGYSGGNTDRPALKLMLEDIKKGYFEAVVVYKLDRLSRSQKDTLTLIEDEFLKHNVDFISVNENFDTTTPFGRAMIGILSVFAQLEKDQITERFTMGRIGRSKQGYFHGGGNAPKGYRYIDGRLIVDEYEAIQVREIFNLFLSGKSINAIQKHMQEKYDNGMWQDANKVSNALKNPIYIGKVRFRKEIYDGQHMPLITEEIFYRADLLLNSSERESMKNTAQKTPFRAGYKLSSLVICGRCGAKYHANHGYYKCYSRAKTTQRFIKDPDCRNDNWLIDDLDDVVINEVYKLKQSDTESLFRENAEKKDNKKALKSEIKKIDTQISKLIELYKVSDIPFESVKTEAAKLSKKKTALENELSSVNAVNHRERFNETINIFEEIIKNNDTDTIRLALSTLIEGVGIDGDKVSIKWRLS